MSAEATPFSAGFSAASTNLSLWPPLFHIQPQPLNCPGSMLQPCVNSTARDLLNIHVFCNMLVPASVALHAWQDTSWCNFGFAPHTNTGWGFYTFLLREHRSQVPGGEYFPQKTEMGGNPAACKLRVSFILPAHSASGKATRRCSHARLLAEAVND